MLSLENVTLVAITSVKIKETLSALKYSMRGIRYGDVLFLSHKKPDNLPNSIRFEYVDKIESIDEYNKTILFELSKHIKTEYMLIVQWDGFVVNPKSWQADFLNYDYVGAPWPKNLNFRDEEGNICRVGNGGASLRTKKIMDYPLKENLRLEIKENEDTFLCCKYRERIKKAGFRFAPVDVAVTFSQERTVSEGKGIIPFAFHQWEGCNAQYPRFDKGVAGRLKSFLIKISIKIGVYNEIHSYFRKVSEK